MMVHNLCFVPFFTDETLAAIFPDVAIFYLVDSKDPGEDDVVHVSSHRILQEEVVCDLIDTHEHQGHLSGGLSPLLLVGIIRNSLLNPINFKCILHDPHVFITLFIALLEIPLGFLWRITLFVHIV
jgi:predicted Co/Zn/Cd cation transporter (cation efflux family)